MDELLACYQELLGDHPKLSLSRFAGEVERPYHVLRDARQNAERSAQRTERRQHVLEEVRLKALEEPLSGYRLIYQALQQDAQQPSPGLHTVRRHMAELKVQRPVPRKKRRPSACPTSIVLWPAGRRVQVDATRLSLPDGICWAYLVLDVESRALLHIEVVRNLSASSAVTALQRGVYVLHHLGIHEQLLIMTDGGSDFTSGAFQAACQELGHWVRAKVSQKGGMGILERLNRTFKYDGVFREELTNIAQLRAFSTKFKNWYNSERRHSSLGYTYPWVKLLAATESSNVA
ncbi:integrase core domain-containing protein [Deinococcus radiophilus]|uniref:integrase core domain-containing protein n=1 Tax=Deinococcus radiophilus TaxID=32062 RepID=UPI001E6521D9|nr:integrase core domain-containing protein [Deinococcus radiophilus]UFA51723.1 integrase core domain-containing protein [Deinococcus radiophilus]